MLLYSSVYTTISGNTLNNNKFGIHVQESSDNTDITENYIYNNDEYGIRIYYSGVPITYNGYNDIWKNVIKNNGKTGTSYKVGIEIRSSSSNNIWENIIEDNENIGINVDSGGFSSNNLIYKNYFIGNTLHGYDDGPNNNWDNTEIGNYWDNYTGSDSDGDGIGDSFYTYIPGSANSNDTLPIYGDPFHQGEKIHIDGLATQGNKTWAWASTRAWCSGSGTINDPYVIEDLNIDGGGTGSCIIIGNSSVYFEIKNCTVYNSGSTSTDAGIKLFNVINSKLIKNNCSNNNNCGIYMESSDSNDILENFLGYNAYGVYLNSSNSNYIAENTFKSNTQNAFEESSSGNTFENNYVVPPTAVSNVTSPNDNGTYRMGEVIEVTIVFTEVVYVTGTPQLTLETGDIDDVVNYVSGSGTTTLSFNYTVGLDDYNPDLDYVSTNALDLNSGTIKGIVGNDAILTLPSPGATGSLSDNKNLFVDAQTPSVTSVNSPELDDIYNVGADLDITVTFSEPVNVSGTPTLTLETNSMPNGIAYYSSGNGTATLTFTYTVAAGHYSADLDYEDTTSLSGTIEDSDKLPADLTLFTPGTAGSLGANKDIIIDTIDPSITDNQPGDNTWRTSAGTIYDVDFSDPTSLLDDAQYKIHSAPNQGGTEILGWTPIFTNLGLATYDTDWSINFAACQEGINYITVRVYDNAGNSDLAEDVFYVYKDSVDPSITDNQLGDNTWRTSAGTIYDVDFSDSTSLLDDAQYKIHNAPNQGGTELLGWTPIFTNLGLATYDTDWSINFAACQEGINYITVRVYDEAGNSDLSEDVFYVYKDTVDPSITDNQAGDDTWRSSSGTIYNVDFSDSTSLLDYAEYKIHSAPNQGGTEILGWTSIFTSLGASSYNTNWPINFAACQEGINYITVRVYDEAGNSDLSEDVFYVRKDITDPTTPSGLYAVPASWTATDDFDIFWSNPSDLSGIAGAYYKLDAAPGSPTDGIYEGGTDIESITGITVGTDGIHTIYLWLVDAAGNIDYNNRATVQLFLDITNPTVINVSSTNSDGSYGIGATIDITITFSEPVYVTGTPTLTLETDSMPNGIAYYSSGNETATLIFTYTVALGHNSSDLDYLSTNALSGTIEDVVGNIADLTLPDPGASGSLGYNKDLVIDTISPVVINVSSSISDGTYGIGEVIDIVIYFSEIVDVTDTPQLILATGSSNAIIDYVGGAGTDALIFAYVVASGHASSDLSYISTDALSGIIRDLAGNIANLTLSTPGSAGSLSDNKDIIIETIQPDITSVSSTKPDGTYGEGEVINIIITFSEPVYVTGTPQLTLETGTIDAVINYVSGSGTITLIFSYTVASGHNSDDLDYVSTGALSLNGGTIEDLVGNDGILTLPTPGGSGSLSFNKDIVIYTQPPPGDLTWVFIVVGSSAGVAAVAVVTVILVRRKRRKNWQN